MIGKRIGPCQILAELGRGGMGEVYRATDSKLKREVAIKVLPAAVALDAERLARFARGQSELVWMDRRGNRSAVAPGVSIEFAEADPTDRRLAAVISALRGRAYDIWLQAAPGLPFSKWTFGPPPGWLYLAWSPDGASLAYANDSRLGRASYEIRRRSVDATSRDETVFTSEDLLYLWTWTPDGKSLVFSPDDDLWRLPLDGSRTPVALTHTPVEQENQAQVSPNGRWLAYSVESGGVEQVFVQAMPPPRRSG